jgi:hypothetical protein
MSNGFGPVGFNGSTQVIEISGQKSEVSSARILAANDPAIAGVPDRVGSVVTPIR